jgi:hypothetical protein
VEANEPLNGRIARDRAWRHRASHRAFGQLPAGDSAVGLEEDQIERGVVVVRSERYGAATIPRW